MWLNTHVRSQGERRSQSKQSAAVSSARDDECDDGSSIYEVSDYATYPSQPYTQHRQDLLRYLMDVWGWLLVVLLAFFAFRISCAGAPSLQRTHVLLFHLI